jgi:hypothetical protein
MFGLDISPLEVLVDNFIFTKTIDITTMRNNEQEGNKKKRFKIFHQITPDIRYIDDRFF